MVFANVQQDLQGADKYNQQYQPNHIDGCMDFGGFKALQQARDQGRAAQRDGDIDEEDEGPGEVVANRTAQDGAQDRRHQRGHGRRSPVRR